MSRHEYRPIAALVVAVAAMCASPDLSWAAETARHARVEEIPGSELKRVILTAEAAQRIAIEMDTVREEPVAATAADAASSASPVPIRVRLPRLDDPEVVARQPYIVVSLGDDDADDDESEMDDVGDDDNIVLVLTNDGGDGAASILTPLDRAFFAAAQHYEVNNPDLHLIPEQRVQGKLAPPGSGKPQKTVPYSAVIYDLRGNTWVYSSPEPLVFVRQPIAIEYVHKDVAVLKQGLATGTAIVSVGAAQLMGVEQRGAK